MNSQSVPGSGGRDLDTTMEAPVRRPRGDTIDLRAIVRQTILADGARIRAVDVGDPQVLDAGAIAQERQLFAVRRKHRLTFERQPADDARGGATVDRQRVNVTQHVERDGAAVGRYRHRGPGRLRRWRTPASGRL